MLFDNIAAKGQTDALPLVVNNGTNRLSVLAKPWPSAITLIKDY
jgi:hypothetical protein